MFSDHSIHFDPLPPFKHPHALLGSVPLHCEHSLEPILETRLLSLLNRNKSIFTQLLTDRGITCHQLHCLHFFSFSLVSSKQQNVFLVWNCSEVVVPDCPFVFLEFTPLAGASIVFLNRLQPFLRDALETVQIFIIETSFKAAESWPFPLLNHLRHIGPLIL